MAKQLPETGYLRLTQIIGDRAADPPIPPLIPVSKSTWWAGVRSGRYPKPTRALGLRITAWSVESIRRFIEESASDGIRQHCAPSDISKRAAEAGVNQERRARQVVLRRKAALLRRGEGHGS